MLSQVRMISSLPVLLDLISKFKKRKIVFDHSIVISLYAYMLKFPCQYLTNFKFYVSECYFIFFVGTNVEWKWVYSFSLFIVYLDSYRPRYPTEYDLLAWFIEFKLDFWLIAYQFLWVI